MDLEEAVLELDPAQLGTLELDEIWVPYVDLYDAGFLPTRVKVTDDEYAYTQSFPVHGHSAVMPQAIRELREKGKRAIVVERNHRYYVFASPP